WAAMLLPCYAALQLVPIPIALLRLLSPARAQSLETLAQIITYTGPRPPMRFAAISANSADSWENLIRLIGYVIVFLLIRELSSRSAARAWQLAWPIILLAT